MSPELGVVHAAKIDALVGTPSVTLEDQNGRHLRERLEHEHGRQQRRAREVALKVLLVDRDVLDRDQTPAWLMLRDRVHQHGRIAVAQPIEKDRNIDHTYRSEAEE